jgi:hypothetical protein
MTGEPQPILNPESSFVVTYHGTDPNFHQLHSRSPNRPACQPEKPPGVLTPLTRAQDSGLMPCRKCWGEDRDER